MNPISGILIITKSPNLILLLLLYLFVPNQIFSQKKTDCNSGIYFTKEDYLNRQFTNPDYNSCNCKVRLKAEKIILKCEEQKHIINKNEVFGYAIEGKNYLIKDNSSYKVEEQETVFVLSKDTFRYIHKGGYTTTEYFFL